MIRCRFTIIITIFVQVLTIGVILKPAYTDMLYNFDSVQNNSLLAVKFPTVPTSLINELPVLINETSGITLVGNEFWTMNDSGGEPELYRIDTRSGLINKVVRISNYQNRDWEAITNDGEFLFVGDFGNNSGSRKDLKILKIPLSALVQDALITEVIAAEICISYADQISFERSPYNHNFDCEAFFSKGDSLYLFTKNWLDENTRVYAVPKEPGTYLLRAYDAYPVEGLVTDAAISPTSNEISLIGYRNYVPFIWLFSDFRGVSFFNGTGFRIDFPELAFVQTEAITFVSDSVLVFTNEASARPAGVFSFTTSGLNDLAVIKASDKQQDEIIFSSYYASESQSIELEIIQLPEPAYFIELYDSKWISCFNSMFTLTVDSGSRKITIPVKDIRSGFFYLKVISGGISKIMKTETNK